MALSATTLSRYDTLRLSNSSIEGLVMRTATWFAPLAAVLAFATPVQAQTQSSSAWISGTGDDGNQNAGCPRTAPCQTLTSALIAVFRGGTISCADPTFTAGSLTISKDVTIDCSGGIVLGDPISGGNGININTAGIEVTLRGLDIISVPIINTPKFGINITAAAQVRVEQCKISGFGQAGVEVAPSSGNVVVKIQDSTITKNTPGVLVAPTGSASVSISIDRSRIENNNGGGVKTDDTTSSAINASVSDSSLSFNADNGLVVVSGSSGTNMVTVKNDVIASNGQAGIEASGANAAVLVNNAVIDSNTGGALSAVSSGRILTYGNNSTVGPAGSGFTGTAPLN
jgi:Right handed beta helix region